MGKVDAVWQPFLGLVVREFLGSDGGGYYFLQDAYGETGYDQLLSYSLVGLGSRQLDLVEFGVVRPTCLNQTYVVLRWT